MYFLITPLRERGRPRDKKEIQSAAPTAGDLRIEHQPSRELGRPTKVAFVHSSTPDAESLPRLFDADVHSMAPNGFVVTGVEIIDGVAYSQSWLCKVG